MLNIIGARNLSNYEIEINEILKNGLGNSKRTGIWARIKNIKTGKVINKQIWWKDSNGVIYDGTLDLPVKLRDLVDKAWLEYR